MRCSSVQGVSGSKYIPYTIQRLMTQFPIGYFFVADAVLRGCGLILCPNHVFPCSTSCACCTGPPRDSSANSAQWRNTGTLGGIFTRGGTPQVRTIGRIQAVVFNGETDWFRGPRAPAALLGNAPRTIELWALNPSVDSDEETLVAWGRRGGPGASDLSLNWGKNSTYGGVTHWDSDLGWNEPPRAGSWHLLAYTYDGKRGSHL